MMSNDFEGYGWPALDVNAGRGPERDERVERAGVRPSEPGSVGPLRAERREDAAIGIDLEVARADLGEPADPGPTAPAAALAVTQRTRRFSRTHPTGPPQSLVARRLSLRA